MEYARQPRQLHTSAPANRLMLFDDEEVTIEVIKIPENFLSVSNEEPLLWWKQNASSFLKLLVMTRNVLGKPYDIYRIFLIFTKSFFLKAAQA